MRATRQQWVVQKASSQVLTVSARTERIVMPLIQVKVIENVFTAEQKQEIVRRLTAAVVEIEGENKRPVTWCMVEEVGCGDCGIAGGPLTTSDVKALAADVGSDLSAHRCPGILTKLDEPTRAAAVTQALTAGLI